MRAMDQEIRRKQNFLLRLPLSVREEAARLAHNDGISLNHFISLAVAEKISVMQRATLHESPQDARLHPSPRSSSHGPARIV